MTLNVPPRSIIRHSGKKIESLAKVTNDYKMTQLVDDDDLFNSHESIMSCGPAGPCLWACRTMSVGLPDHVIMSMANSEDIRHNSPNQFPLSLLS